MPKIKLRTTLKTKQEVIDCCVNAIKNNEHYSYVENDFIVVVDIHRDCVKMVRKKEDYELEFLFSQNDNSECIIHLGESTTSIPLITKRLEINKSKILIVYEIEEEEFQYLIQY